MTGGSPAYPNIRIYFQMKPDQASLKHLTGLQAALPAQPRGRTTPAHGLHLTLIHYGKAHDVYDTIAGLTNIPYPAYQVRLQDYIVTSSRHMPVEPVTLEPIGLAAFGQRGGTMVVEYTPTPELLRQHQLLYQELRGFLQDCGIASVDSFMAGDINFMHASVLRPHITLYKGYAGDMPELKLQPVTLLPMETVYPPVD